MVQKLLLITTFCLVVFTSLWAQTPPTIGDGSISNPYQIATSENLIWLSQNSSKWNKHYKQIADIVFAESGTQDWGNEDNGSETKGFSPIGNTMIPFSGSYDGGGHEIDGLYINNSTNEYIALFGVIISGSETDTVLIKNIGIGANSTIISNRRDHTLIQVAALVASAFTPISIDSCYNKGSISATTYSYCISAGLVANAGCLVISNSYNSGSVSSSGLSGGLIGNSYSVTISNCYNKGSVSANSSKDVICGGLIGQSQSSASNSITINNSYNSGSVSTNSHSIGSCSGGLVGFYDYDLTISNSYNKGAVFSNVQSGGLVGLSKSRSSSASSISNSYNIGVISSNRTGGGLVGHIQSSSSSSFTINNSYNNDSVASFSYSGGLVGCSVSAIAINTSSNEGVISSNLHSGGLVGNSNSDLTISNSSNRGKISSISMSNNGVESNSSGGLVGFSKTDKTIVSIISNSYNSGNISTFSDNSRLSYSGGLIGHSSYLNIIQSYNIGTVTCCASVSPPTSGGLVGASVSALTINSSFNLGNVSSSSSDNRFAKSNCGGLVGQLSSYGTEANFSISNSYNSGSVSSTTLVAASVHSKSYSGGLIGISESLIHLIIRNCYANGSVSSIASDFTYGGALIGLLYSDSDLNISNSYFDTETSIQTMIIGNEVDLSNVASSGGMTTEAFKNKGSFNQWFNKTADNDNPWVFNKNGYPYLYWQKVDFK